MPVARCRIEPSMVTCHFQTCMCGDIGRLSVHSDMRSFPLAPASDQAYAAVVDGIRPRLGPVNASQNASNAASWLGAASAPHRRDEDNNSGNGAGAGAAF